MCFDLRKLRTELPRSGYMISLEEYKEIIADLLDELPEEFFRELSGGVIVSRAAVLPDFARDSDIYTLGRYEVSYGMRQIKMFKGSFDRLYPQADAEEARELLRGILRHEFRHHLEDLGDIHNSSSLEAEDERERQEYLSRHEE